MDAVNIHQVFDWLWTSGQLSQGDVLALPDLGIEVVINLALPSSPNALPAMRPSWSLVWAWPMCKFQWNGSTPYRSNLISLSGVLNAFAGRKIWLHCAMNMRVSAFVYLYRKLVLGEGEENATFPMRDIWQPNETWQQFIDRVVSARS